MRTLVVTSRVTFVPGNYMAFLRALLDGAREQVVAVLLLDNLSTGLLKSTAGLLRYGARGLGMTLAANVVSVLQDPRVKLAESLGIACGQAVSVNDPNTLSWIRKRQIDLVVNARTRCIYGREALSVAPMGCINIHHGLLPEHRGTMCDAYALADGRDAGFSIHVMTEKLDDGPILLREVVSPAGSSKDYLGHIERSSRIEGERLASLLRTIASQKGLPEGLPNRTERRVYSKTPQSGDEIAALIAQGLRV